MNRIVSLGVSCLVLVSAGCADDAAGPARPRMLLTAAPTAPTHPAGVIKLSAPLPGRPYGLAISNHEAAYITQLISSPVARVDLPSALAFPASIPRSAIPPIVATHPSAHTASITNP